MISRSDVVSQTLFENRLSHFWCIKSPSPQNQKGKFQL